MNKWKNLIVGIVIDGIGMSTYLVPALGESADLVFAPLQAWYIYNTYGDAFMAGVGLAEELVPFTDIIPSCTIAWVKNEVMKK